MFVIREGLYAHPVLSSTGQENNALTSLYRKWTIVQTGSRFHSCRLCKSQLTKSNIVEMLLGVQLYKNKDKFIYRKSYYSELQYVMLAHWKFSASGLV
jgi:hypothetical protein